jgi:hypothetical protein
MLILDNQQFLHILYTVFAFDFIIIIIIITL